MNCSKCGTPLAEGAVFCATCGTRVDEASAAQPQPQPQAQPQPQPQYQPQYQTAYRQPRQPGQGFLTFNPYVLEMILKIGAMVVAVFALVGFIISLTYYNGFVSGLSTLISGGGLAWTMWAVGQLLVTLERKK